MRCSTGNQSKSGEKRMFKNKVTTFAWTTNNVSRAQTSRQDGGLSAMFMSQAIELCYVSKVVLHRAATFLWIKSLFEQIMSISLTAVCVVKTGFKVKGILQCMQPQLGQPFFVNHLIGVLA